MAAPFAAKKWPFRRCDDQASQLDISSKNGPHRSDGKSKISGWTDANLMAGLGAAALSPALARELLPLKARPSLALQAKAGASCSASGRTGYADLGAARPGAQIQARR